MGKRGRREARRERRQEEARALLERTAVAQGISAEEAEEQFIALAEIRAEHEARLEGSGMRVKDVRYDHATGHVEVIVEPLKIEGRPAGWSKEASDELEAVRRDVETKLLAKGRGRVAEIELGRAFGARRAGLGAMIAQVAPDVVRAAAPVRGIEPRSLTFSIVEGGGTGQVIGHVPYVPPEAMEGT